nr:immunoglobulin heavy chain junction region [Mus musculus]MBK4196316.1 immunoglobulin heavy chain junction region [Mus musculus]
CAREYYGSSSRWYFDVW